MVSPGSDQLLRLQGVSMKTWQIVALAAGAYYLWKRSQPVLPTLAAQGAAATGAGGDLPEIPFGLHAPNIMPGQTSFPQAMHANIGNNMPESAMLDLESSGMPWPDSQERIGFNNRTQQYIYPEYRGT